MSNLSNWEVPKFEEVVTKRDDGEYLTPLDEFVYDNTPAFETDEIFFYLSLQKAIDFCILYRKVASPTPEEINISP